jgi:hypothetical protein
MKNNNSIRVTLSKANLVSSEQEHGRTCQLFFELTPTPDHAWLESFLYLKNLTLETIRQRQIDEMETEAEILPEIPWEISLVKNSDQLIEAFCEPDDKERLCQEVKKLVEKINADYPRQLKRQDEEKAYKLSFQKQIEELKTTFNSA